MVKTPVTLKKTGMATAFGGVFSKNKKTDINIQYSGLVEACYDKDLARELLEIGNKHYWGESIGFITGVNHVLRRKVGIGTKTARMAGLTRHGSMDDHMQQLYDLYVPEGSDKEVNIRYGNRTMLVTKWTSIKSAQAVGMLLKARYDVVSMCVRDCLKRDVQKHLISPRLARTLELKPSPSDEEVLKRLTAQGPALIEFQSGRKLSPEETRAQYAAMYE